MSNSLMSSAQTSSKARIVRVVGKIKVVRSSKQRQTCAESIFQERQVNIRIRAALGHLSEKNALYNKNNRHKTLGVFFARIISHKNQAENSQGNASKSTKSTSSGSSEGSDPDPEAYSSLAFLFSFWSFLSLLISLLFVYACISIIEVVA